MCGAGQFSCLFYSSLIRSFTPAVLTPAVCVGSPGVHWLYYAVCCMFRVACKNGGLSAGCRCRFHRFFNGAVLGYGGLRLRIVEP
jgi:hypothetical protein